MSISVQHHYILFEEISEPSLAQLFSILPYWVSFFLETFAAVGRELELAYLVAHPSNQLQDVHVFGFRVSLQVVQSYGQSAVMRVFYNLAGL